MPRAIDISDLPQPLIDAIETIVRAYRERGAAPRASSPAAQPSSPLTPTPFREVTPLRVGGTPASEILIQDRR